VPVREQRVAEYENVSDVPELKIREIEYFIEVFKDLEGSEVGAVGWEGAQRAEALVEEAIRTGEAGEGEEAPAKDCP
jgi:inorganic pyrophosphatase